MLELKCKLSNLKKYIGNKVKTISSLLFSIENRGPRGIQIQGCMTYIYVYTSLTDLKRKKRFSLPCLLHGHFLSSSSFFIAILDSFSHRHSRFFSILPQPSFFFLSLSFSLWFSVFGFFFKTAKENLFWEWWLRKKRRSVDNSSKERRREK